MNQFVFTNNDAETGFRHNARSLLSTFPASRSRGARAVGHETFVNAMKGAVTGVNIVTTDGKAGRFGLTVSAFASVSAEPPLVLVCINRKSPACRATLDNRRFCVNVLSSAQQGIAETFAGFPSRGAPYEFVADEWETAVSGNPVLQRAVATFDCSVVTAIDAGTHTVFTGLVESATAGDDEPLLYCNRNFGRIMHCRDRAGTTRS